MAHHLVLKALEVFQMKPERRTWFVVYEEKTHTPFFVKKRQVVGGKGDGRRRWNFYSGDPRVMTDERE